MGLRCSLISLAVVAFLFPSVAGLAADSSTEYQYDIDEGVRAFKAHDDRSAYDYFNKAHILAPAAEEPLEYVNLLKRLYDGRLEDLSGRKIDEDRLTAVNNDLDRAGRPSIPSGKTAVPSPVVAEPAVVHVSSAASKRAPEVISIDDILKADPVKPTIRIELGSAVIIEGRDVKRFLEVDPGFLLVSLQGHDQIRVEAKKWGNVFLHIWDGRGRTTLYIEIAWPQEAQTPEEAQAAAGVGHTPPFRMRYGWDYSSYYSGPDTSNLRRSSLYLQQNGGIEGQTPYGYFDSSLTAKGFSPITDIPTYTVGLTRVPLNDSTGMDARIFDANRSLSPLTMPGQRLRGEFLDLRMFENLVGLSLSHGSELASFSYLPQSKVRIKDSFVDAVSVSLFPASQEHRYTLNYAVGHGAEREPFLTKKVYSLQGQQKAGPFDLNAELARDDRTTASLAGIDWSNGALRQGLHFRDINKQYSTVLASPSNQGEVGVTWTTGMSTERFSSDSFVDVYQDRLYPNLDHPDALNEDSSAHIRMPVGDHYALDTTGRFVNTPGQESPRTYASIDQRVTRDFNFFGGRKGTVYVGGNDQISRYEFSPVSEYDRLGLISGVQVPLTRSLSGFMNYEYSWLWEKLTGDEFHPAVFNAGLAYSKEINERLVGNLGVTYRNEKGAKGANSFLAGEDSVMGSAGFTYTPRKDVNLFCDTRLGSVWSQVPDGASYNDLDIRLGMRMAWGLGASWDPLGTVSGFVFKDRDGDKKFTPDIGGVAGDEGLPGVRVRIGDKEAVTDDRGWYSLAVRARNVVVAPVMESLPPGFVFSTPAFSKVDIVQDHLRRVDFGLTSQSGIYGVAFVDNNANGVPDQNDRFVARVKVLLDGKTAQITDSRGAYFFKNIKDGKHVLSIDMGSLPAEFIPLVKVKNDVDVEEGTTYVFHIPLKVKAKN